MKYLDLLKANKEFRKLDDKNPVCDVLVLSNITLQPMKEYLEYHLRNHGLSPKVRFGDYDNILQDALALKQFPDVIIVFQEVANLIDGLEYRAETMDQDHLNALVQKVKSELDMIFEGLKSAPLVLFNRYSALGFSNESIEDQQVDSVTALLNRYIEEKAPDNFRLISLDKILVKLGVDQCLDFKGYFKNKTLYKHVFYFEYNHRISYYIRALKGKLKKALVLDCDNTLWKGVLGEDGISAINMSAHSAEGLPFHAAQHTYLKLAKQGVIVCLCSKNNHKDVQEVLNEHGDLLLKEQYIVSAKVNWQPKSVNIAALIQELNIGEDAFVFIDDSNFEREQVASELTGVEVIVVPENIYDYPRVARRIANEFISLTRTDEDLKKIDQYKENARRASEKERFTNIDDFLASLDIELKIYKDDLSIVERMSQMTQKTNQFNLTTKRYSVNDMTEFVKSDGHHVYAFRAIDKFGDSGITGLCIIKGGKVAEVDSLLMSCRILGRNIEQKFMHFVLHDLSFEVLKAQYIKTAKNNQVSNYFDRLGFSCDKATDDRKSYSITCGDLKAIADVSYINLIT